MEKLSKQYLLKMKPDLMNTIDMAFSKFLKATGKYITKAEFMRGILETQCVLLNKENMDIRTIKTYDLRVAIADFKGNFPSNWRDIICNKLNILSEDLEVELAAMELEDKELANKGKLK